LVKFSGTVRDEQGKPQSGVVGITFALYKDQEGGAPLWLETQNVQADANGHYTTMLGATNSDGLPMEFFTSNEARWVGVQPQGQNEQPRVLLVSAPYALKAADSETLGGKPASAYVTTEALDTAGVSAPTSAGVQAQGSTLAAGRANKNTSSAGPLPCTNITADGTATANFVAKFTSPCVIHQSAIFESSGKVGIGSTSPAGTLDVNGNTFTRGTFNLNQTTSSSVGVINIGSVPFIHACCSGASNTFVGFNAGNFTTTGSQNTVVGTDALLKIGSGNANTAIGVNALISNTSGSLNTAIGVGSLNNNTFGHDNTAIGFNALYSNTTGFFNTAVGEAAGVNNGTGSKNTALGYGADVCCNLTNATAVGAFATVGESNALVLGCTNCQFGASPPNVGIGNANPNAKLDIIVPNSGIQHLLFFGDTVGGSGDVAAFSYNATTSPFPLVLNLNHARPFTILGGNVGIGTFFPDNTLSVFGSADKTGGGSWGVYSDGRLKTVQATYDAGLDAILKLTPVRYRYKEQNAMGIKDDEEHVGFVAQEVEKVIPEAVSRNSRGYLLVNNDPILWTMLNAIKQQQAEIEALTISVHEKAAQIQKLMQETQALREVQSQVEALPGLMAPVDVKSDGTSVTATAFVARELMR
jgi:hypothetical protein